MKKMKKSEKLSSRNDEIQKSQHNESKILSNKENNQIEKNESDIILPKSKNESVNQEKKESEKIPSRNEKTSELNNLLLDTEKDLQTKKEEENKENNINNFKSFYNSSIETFYNTNKDNLNNLFISWTSFNDKIIEELKDGIDCLDKFYNFGNYTFSFYDELMIIYDAYINICFF